MGQTGAVSEVVEVPIGQDRFRAEVIRAACESSGVNARLVMADEHGHRSVPLGEHRLMVLADDLPVVHEILADAGLA